MSQRSDSGVNGRVDVALPVGVAVLVTNSPFAQDAVYNPVNNGLYPFYLTQVNSIDPAQATGDPIRPGDAPKFTLDGAVYLFTLGGPAGNVAGSATIDAPTATISPATLASALAAIGGGTGTSKVSQRFTQGGDVVCSRVPATRTIDGLKAIGKIGSCRVEYLTAAQYAANPDNMDPGTTLGTVLGTLSVATDGVASATIAAGQSVVAGDWYRYVPNNPNGPLHVYESV